MSYVAQGQITLYDTTDGRSLSAYLKVNHPTVQVKDKDLTGNKAYAPDYAATPLIVTPQLYISGDATERLSAPYSAQTGGVQNAPQWRINGEVVPTSGLAKYGASIASTRPYALTIARNLDGVSQLSIECQIAYTELPINATTTAIAGVTVTRLDNAGNLVFARVRSIAGNVISQDIPSLDIMAELWRGAGIDKTGVEYSWSMLTTSGWQTISSTTHPAIKGLKPASNAEASDHTPTVVQTTIDKACSGLRVPASAVLNVTTFKCELKDIEAGSNTQNKVFADTITLVDHTDPYRIELVAPNGDKLIRGQGNIVVNAIVSQAGTTIPPERFNFTWSMVDRNGAPKNFASPKTGASITITSADITVMSTIFCKISVK